MFEMNDGNLNFRDALEIGKTIVEGIKKAGPNPGEGIKIVIKVVYRELRKANYTQEQLMSIANTILDCVIEEYKKTSLKEH
jgi:hypothetical protein